MDDLPRVLPVPVAVRLRLFGLDHAQACAAPAGRCTRRPADIEPGVAPDHCRCGVEAARRRRPYVADTRVAGGDYRASLLSALDHRAAGAGVVRAELSRRHRLQAVCALQLRLAPRADRVPVRVRAVDHYDAAIVRLDRGLCGVRPVVHRRGALQHPRPRGRRGGTRRGNRGERRSQAHGTGLRAVARALGDGFVHAAGRDQPHHPRRRFRAVPVDTAAHAVSRDLHPVLRGTRLVPAPHLPRAGAGRRRRDGVGAQFPQWHPGHQGSDPVVFRGAVRVLHVLPRRTRQPQACAAISHDFLPHGGARRRAGRGAHWFRRTQAVQHLLRVRHRARRDAAARRLAHPQAHAADPRRHPGHSWLHRLPRLRVHPHAGAGYARHDPQFLRHAAREGCRRRGERRSPAPADARRDHARGTVPGAGAPRRTHDLLRRDLGCRTSHQDASRRATAGWRRRPGDRHARRIRTRRGRLPVLRAQSAGDRHSAQRVLFSRRQRGAHRNRARRRAPHDGAGAAPAVRHPGDRRVFERLDSGASRHARSDDGVPQARENRWRRRVPRDQPLPQARAGGEAHRRRVFARERPHHRRGRRQRSRQDRLDAGHTRSGAVEARADRRRSERDSGDQRPAAVDG